TAETVHRDRAAAGVARPPSARAPARKAGPSRAERMAPAPVSCAVLGPVREGMKPYRQQRNFVLAMAALARAGRGPEGLPVATGVGARATHPPAAGPRPGRRAPGRVALCQG